MTQLVELAKKIALFAAEQQFSVPTENQQTLSSPHGGTESVMSKYINTCIMFCHEQTGSRNLKA